MKRSLLMGAVSAVAMIGAAQAADMGGGMKEAEAAPPIWNWAGFYAGVNGGYIWGSGVAVSEFECGWYCGGGIWNNQAGFGSRSSDGGFGGGQIGFNLQRDRLVYGIEADIQGASMSANREADDGWANPFSHAHDQAGLDWFGSVRGRLGLVPWQNILVYITGGVAFGGVQNNLGQDYYSYTLGQYANMSPHNNNDVHAGYDLGAGVEYGLTPAWSVKLEYQFMDLGNDKVYLDYKDPKGCFEVASFAESKLSFNTVRIGINYHFIPEYVPLK